MHACLSARPSWVQSLAQEKRTNLIWVWEHTFGISALGRPRQEEPQEFKVSEFMLSLGYIASKTLSQNTCMPNCTGTLIS